MTNYILTVGMSVLTNLTQGTGRSQQPFTSMIQQFLENADATARHDLEEMIERHQVVKRLQAYGVRDVEAGSGSPLDDIDDIVKELEELDLPTGWNLGELCAEGSALRAATRGHGIALEPDDRLNLLVSDTNDGLLAGLVVAWLFAKRIASCRVRSSDHHRPPPTWAEVGAGPAASARLWIVDGLTATDPVSFTRSMHALGVAVGLAFDRALKNLVLLSGGYKAVPPHVVACCEYLQNFGDISVQMIFEEGREPLDVALRPVAQGWIEPLKEAARSGRPVESSDPLYRWVIDENGPTGFGRALLGAADSPVGPG